MTTFVLIHGAYQGGWIWKPVAERLRAQGHLVLAPSLDGCAERKGQCGRHHHRDARRRDRRPAFLPGPEGRRAGRHQFRRHGGGARRGAGARADGALVFADALALFDGEALPDIVNRPTAVTPHCRSGPSREDSETRLSPISTQRAGRWPLHAASDRGDASAGQARPFWGQAWNASVIWCKRSANPPRRISAAPPTLKGRWHELDTGHYPMLTEPEALARLIAEG